MTTTIGTSADSSDDNATVRDVITGLRVEQIDYAHAMKLVVDKHYLHRKCPVSWAFGLFQGPALVGAVTFGTPASRHLQKSACPTRPELVVELNRLWTKDELPKNTESWFVSRALRQLPPRIVVSYSDPKFGHYGYVYRALNFHYAGWTDMERKTPRFDYVPIDPTKHTREAFRTGYAYKVRRIAKVKYWLATGNKSERRALERICGWPSMDWKADPPPRPTEAQAI